MIAVGAGETPPGAIDFEELLATADAEAFSYRDIDERSAAAMCSRAARRASRRASSTRIARS